MPSAPHSLIGGLCAVAGLLLIAPARGEEPRYVPAAGTSLTYKVMNTSTVAPNPPFTTGWTLVYKVKSSDDLTWDGSIELKTSYVSPVCPAHNCDKVNQEAEQAHARKEGELFAIDLPGNIADELTKLSAVRYRYLIRELEQFPFPRMGQGGFEPGPSFVLSTRLECDKALLASFFPLGKTPRVSVPCTRIRGQRPGDHRGRRVGGAERSGDHHPAGYAGDFGKRDPVFGATRRDRQIAHGEPCRQRQAQRSERSGADRGFSVIGAAVDRR
jgi:hypothetical protein